MNRIILSFLFIIGFASLTQTAMADILCVKKTVKPTRTGKIKLSAALQVASGTTCPAGHAELLDTEVFKGDTGPRGYSSWDNIPAGQQIRGRFTEVHSIGTPTVEYTSAIGSFPALASETLPTSRIILKITPAVSQACPILSDCIDATTLSNSIANASKCPGTSELPSAAEGYVCIYPFSFSNIIAFATSGNSPAQFSITWMINGTVSQGITIFDAPWAYQQPSSAALRTATFQGADNLEHKRDLLSGSKE